MKIRRYSNEKNVEYSKDNFEKRNGKGAGDRRTVGLCIIALLLCVVMKDSLTAFIQTIVSAMTAQAQQILNGVQP